jgi:hypothetical protein
MRTIAHISMSSRAGSGMGSQSFWLDFRLQALCCFRKNGKVIPIPVHGAGDIGSHLLSNIERQTGVKLK